MCKRLTSDIKHFTIKQILIDHWSDFVKSNPELNIRPVVFKEFNLSKKLIKCQHRHLVFTIPKELRSIFRQDRSLLSILFHAVSETILSWFASQNKKECFTPGFVSTLHTFGRDLKWNPHIHTLITEEASGNITAFDFIKRLIIHIPETQFKTVRYYGLYAKKHKFSHLLFKMLPQTKRIFHERYSHWRERILLSFGYDPLKCSCGHIMELVDIFYPANLSYNSS